MNLAPNMPVADDTVELDIAIVGAGLVGVPLAAALAKQGWRIGLLDANEAPADPAGNGAADPDATAKLPADTDPNLNQRCTALSLGTQQWYADNALWDIVAAEASAINRVNVSHKGYFGATRLEAAELGVPAVGFVVNNSDFIRRQREHLNATPVSFFAGARVSAVNYQADAVTLRTSAGDTFRARLLIAADGVGSVVRESAGIGTTQVDYQQAAVLGMVKLDDAHQGVAHERFTPTGPLALLPRPGPYMSFVDCIEPDSQDAITGLSSEAYLARLQTRFGYRLGRMAAVGPRFVTPLVRIEAQSQIAARTVLLGNAMRLLHPVGGQGYNLAMRDVAQLVDLLAASNQADPGSEMLLGEFVELRRTDQQQVVRFTDLLARGFRGRSALPGHVRSAALLGLDMLPPLRRKFASLTMGHSASR